MSSPVVIQGVFGLTAEVLKLSNTAARATVAPSAELPYLRGHLPNLPVVPGMALVDLVPRIGEAAGLCHPPVRALELARFFSPLKPGEHLSLEVDFANTTGRLRARGTIDERELGEIVWSYDSANNA